MKSQRLFIGGLVIVNLALLGRQFAQGKPEQLNDVAPIVRARALSTR